MYHPSLPTSWEALLHERTKIIAKGKNFYYFTLSWPRYMVMNRAIVIIIKSLHWCSAPKPFSLANRIYDSKYMWKQGFIKGSHIIKEASLREHLRFLCFMHYCQKSNENVSSTDNWIYTVKVYPNQYFTGS